MGKALICPKCNSNDILVQAVTTHSSDNEGKSVAWWLLVGWWWSLMKLFVKAIMWVVFGLFMLIPRLFGRKKKKNNVKSTTHTEATCQNCGNRWKVD